MTIREYLLHSELMPIVVACGGFLLFLAVEIIRSLVRGHRRPLRRLGPSPRFHHDIRARLRLPTKTHP